MSDMRSSSARPLRWSVGWQGVLDDILATYPITKSPGGGWRVASPFGASFSALAYKDALAWAVDDFSTRLRSVASHQSEPRLGALSCLADDVITGMQVL